MGDFAAPVSALTHVPHGYACDLVLLSCKAWDLDSAIAAIAPAVGPDTRVLPLLGGLRHLDLLDLAFGRGRVWGGVAHIWSRCGDDGGVRHFGSVARLAFGARGADPRCDALAPGLPLALRARCAGARISLTAMWGKARLHCHAGRRMTCLLRGSVGGSSPRPTAPP